MRIDDECVRDILLTIEKVSTYKEPFKFFGEKNKYEPLQKYDGGKISYHLRYLLMSNLIYSPDEHTGKSKDEFYVDLTPDGHKFISNILNGKN